MRYLGLKWDETCQHCSRIFKVYEFCQTTVCDECYIKYKDYYDLLDTCAFFWLITGFIAFVWMVFSFASGAWLNALLAILLGFSSFFAFAIPELIINKDKQPPRGKD